MDGAGLVCVPRPARVRRRAPENQRGKLDRAKRWHCWHALLVQHSERGRGICRHHRYSSALLTTYNPPLHLKEPRREGGQRVLVGVVAKHRLHPLLFHQPLLDCYRPRHVTAPLALASKFYGL